MPILFPQDAKCAVSLTYDDAPISHVDTVLPALDERGLKGTFYSQTQDDAIAWKPNHHVFAAAAKHGHELGNHTQFHPCRGREYEGWVLPFLEDYTPADFKNELLAAEEDLAELDGGKTRSFAYTCCHETVGDPPAPIHDEVLSLFPSARTGWSPLPDVETVPMAQIPSLPVQPHHTGDDLIALVNEAREKGSWAVFMFHKVADDQSVWGDYDGPVQPHTELLDHLAASDDVWTATFIEVTQHLRAQRNEPWSPS